MSEVLDAESGELVPIATPSVTLFRTDSPSEVVASATETANVLASVVKAKKLTATIQGREHVLVEGWTLLGSMLGVFPVCTWTRKLEDGWEARVEARTRDGAVVGAAEAECLRSERTWANRDDYALRSMAQTRATSKALRQPLGFVMSLAGFEATPAEEMPPAVVESAPERASKPQQNNIHRLISKIVAEGVLEEVQIREGMQQAYGTQITARLSKSDAGDLITRLKAKAGEE